MSDFIVRAITSDGFIKATATQTTETVGRAREIHRTLPLASAALGRTLTAASMMGDELKSDNASLTLSIRGSGPLGAITAVSDSGGNVRGYLQNPAVTMPLKPSGKLDVSGGVGESGVLTVIKDFGAGEPFTGKIELVSGEIAEDIAAYYVISEQVPAVCALGVLVDTDLSVRCAGGYIIQLMPGAPDGLVDRLESAVAAAPAITTMLDSGMDAAQALERVLDGFGLQIIERHDICYECKCSEHKVERALRSMGADEIRALIEREGSAHVTCQFCDREYTFGRKYLEALLVRQETDNRQ